MSPAAYMLQGTIASTDHYDHISNHPKHLLFLITVVQFVTIHVPKTHPFDIVAK